MLWISCWMNASFPLSILENGFVRWRIHPFCFCVLSAVLFGLHWMHRPKKKHEKITAQGSTFFFFLSCSHGINVLCKQAWSSFSHLCLKKKTSLVEVDLSPLQSFSITQRRREKKQHCKVEVRISAVKRARVVQAATSWLPEPPRDLHKGH